MNSDSIKGVLQKASGHIEEAAGALVGSENLKVAGKEDQLAGAAREAWGNVKDAGNSLIDKVKAAKYDAEQKTSESQAYQADHAVIIEKDPKAETESDSE